MPGQENAWGFKDVKKKKKKIWQTSGGRFSQNKYSLVLRKLFSY